MGWLLTNQYFEKSRIVYGGVFAGLTCFFIASNALSAQGAPIEFSRTTGRLAVGQLLEVLEENDRPLSLLEIRERPDSDWQKHSRDRLVVGINGNPLWFRFRFADTAQTIPRAILTFKSPQMDHIEFYIPDDNGYYTKQVTGDHYPFQSRDVKDRYLSFRISPKSAPGKFYYIRLDNFISYTGGIITLFTPETYHSFVQLETLALGLYFGFLGVMCLYNLFIYFSSREITFFYYACFIFFNLMSVLSLEGVGFQYLYPDVPWFQNKGMLALAPLTMVFALIFADRYLNLAEILPRAQTFVRGLIILHLAQIPIFHFILVRFHPQQSIFFSYLLLLLTLFVLLSLGIFLTWRKDRSAKFFLTAWSILILSVVVRILAGVKIIPQNILTDWSVQLGGALEVTLLSFGLADRINYLKNRLTRSNEELEVRVKQRTRDLSQSLKRVRELKKNQDGDYFLTSQLVKLLGSNNSRNKRVNVEFLVRQKKRFTFRGQRDEIGGDLCVAENIKLIDKQYTVFLNGDAMGKSLQGAGGALVLGSVFEAIVERTRSDQGDLKKRSPEDWLKNAYRELHRVFETFEGGMLVSAVLGLVEEETGTLFLLNAEHPRTVLYRKSVAFFLEDQIILGKLGALNVSKKLDILRMRLQPDDLLIVGSDGRDDLIEKTKTGVSNNSSLINEDDDAFLRHVESGGGNLREIYKHIRRSGGLIDDISLIGVRYTGDTPPG